jgi:predicted MFS family arabinose efflux permease
MATEARTSNRRWMVQLLVLWGVQLVDVLVVTSVTPAIPALVADTGAPPGAATLVAASAAMVFAGLLLLSARLADRYGHRRILLAGLAVFGLAAVTGGTAHSIGQVVAARIGQGAAAALCVPAAMWVLLRLSPQPGRRRTALAGWSAGGAVAGVLGYVVGGGLTQALSWHWVFWINAPITVVLIAGVLLLVPADPADPGVRLDVWGAVLLTAAIMAIVGAASVLQDGRVALGSAGLVVGAALGASFAAQQRGAADPLVPRAGLRDAHLRLGSAVSFVNTATTSGIAIVVVLLLQNALGLSPATAAFAMMPLSGAVVIGSVLSRLPALTSDSVRPTVLGLVAIAAGGLILALRHDRIPVIVVAMSIAGAGLGLASVGATSIGTASTVGTGESGSAALGLLNTAAQLGNALGVAALLGLTTLPEGGTSVGFLVVTAAGLATAFWVHRSSRQAGKN